jgi:hypothetical protein
VSEENKRRIILPARAERPKDISVVLEPVVPTLLQDALSVLASEIVRFKAKTNKGESLKVDEARVLQGYIRSLVELSKEQREREDTSDWANLSDAELLALVDQLRTKRLEGAK